MTNCQSEHSELQCQCDGEFGHIGIHANLVHSVGWFYTEEEIIELPPYIVSESGTPFQEMWSGKVFIDNKWGVPNMSDLETFRAWVNNIANDLCPLCGERIDFHAFGNMRLSPDVPVCGNDECLFRFTSLGVMKEYSNVLSG